MKMHQLRIQMSARWFCFKIHWKQGWDRFRLGLYEYEDTIVAVAYAILALILAFVSCLYVHALGG